MGLISRALARAGYQKQVSEGSLSQGPWFLPFTGGWLGAEAGSQWNWWQSGYDVQRGSSVAMVEACVSAYAQTIAMCPGDHWLMNDKGGRDRKTQSALTRVLRRPNDYQTISDFLLNAVRSLYLRGNTYALALQNDRFEITELHLMHPDHSKALISPDGDIFYELGGNEILSRRVGGEKIYAPARNVLHVRLHTPVHPLKGETPIAAAAIDIASAGAMTQQQYNFFMNQARPSYVLGTDAIINKEQADDLRTRWNEQSQGLNAGKTPILTAGLKPMPLSVSAKDSTIVDMLKMSDQHISLAFRCPLQILGIGGTPYASTELLMQSWIATGLGFALNHIEEAIGVLFKLRGQPEEYLEFNTSALLRSSFKERIEGLALGTRAGLLAPNEGRAELELPRVAHGDQPRMQQQDVPLSYGDELQPPAPAAPAPDNPPEPDAPPEEDDPPEDDPPEDSEKSAADLAKKIIEAADAYDRTTA